MLQIQIWLAELTTFPGLIILVLMINKFLKLNRGISQLNIRGISIQCQTLLRLPNHDLFILRISTSEHSYTYFVSNFVV